MICLLSKEFNSFNITSMMKISSKILVIANAMLGDYSSF